jgi:spermidine synthase
MLGVYHVRGAGLVIRLPSLRGFRRIGNRIAVYSSEMGEQMGFQSTGRQAPRATWTLRVILSLIGFTAVIAQVVLMRELLVVFYGNELALGVMLANWLLWTALGASLLGRWAMRSSHPRKLVAGLQALLAFALPLTLLAVRASKGFCQSVPGEILGPVPMFLTSFATLSVLCVISGGLFAAGSRLFADVAGASTATATGAVYLLEAAGSGVGGVLAGLALVRLANPFEITALVGVLNLLAAWALLAPVGAWRRALAASFAGMAALVLIGGYELQPLSLARLWRGFHLVAAQNSVYGSLAVVETGASRSLFENGLIVMTVPDPAAAEEAVHFALLEHPDPRRLLLIGGGVNGSVAEALTHPSLERVDYVELDPMIFDIAARYFPAAWEKIRRDSRVHVQAMDGRRFLKTTGDSFDVIIVNLPDPHTAQLNRFYTEEFYREAAAKLDPGGIVSFQVTSSENYISQELADFLRCLERTLRRVFPEVTAIPGATVHFFAAAKPGTLTNDSQELLRRLRARRLHTQYVREYFLPFRMSPDRMQDLQLQIEPLPSTPVNHDFAPVAYYFDVVLWSASFHQTSAHWIEALASISFKWLLVATTLALAALVPLLWMWPAGREDKRAARARRSAAFAVAVVGFTELGLEILLLLGFQALYGYVYHDLTILVALFMVGVAMGAWWALRLAPTSWRRDLRLLAGLQILLAASPLLLFGLLVQLGRVSSAGGQRAASEILFPALALVAGLLGGFQFLLASRAYFGDAPEIGRSPGVLYALDLAGACAGALALSVLLIPVHGFLRTAVLMAAVNLAPAVMAAACGRERLAGQGRFPHQVSARQKPAL